MNNEEKLSQFLKNNNGYISTSELLGLNIYKSQIDSYINKIHNLLFEIIECLY